ncbi:hypothetical protein EGY19_06970 [Burkholderia multivorans]|nr:hypothetical protein EGY19_06970 [Burkholderia multivorans]PRF47914.1 hypothetical protein C6Q04_15070 [Burkholderia multivorans]PRG49604.1 hypothetical protein C6T63_20060 [Burkholderia multivorans]
MIAVDNARAIRVQNPFPSRVLDAIKNQIGGMVDTLDGNFLSRVALGLSVQYIRRAFESPMSREFRKINHWLT